MRFIAMYISSKWVYRTSMHGLSILLPYYRLQEVNWILNKRRPRVKGALE